jgi:nicotinamidase/pyrazinamidase
MRVELIIIDPQVDFCSPTSGKLYVQGAENDISRIAAMIKRIGAKLDDIHVTIDSHHLIDIAHPIFWKDAQGNHPNPFTIISAADVDSGVWTTTIPGMYRRGLDYVKALDSAKRYPLCIWPPHCLIGTEGQTIMPELSDALLEWEAKELGLVDYVTKGSNIYSEHYSAVQAEVPDPTDPSTQINKPLIQTLENADLVLWAGEAGSHCLANTFRDTVNNFANPDYIKRQVLLTDATCPVTGFESLQSDFITEMTAKGMQVSTTVDILK